MLKYLALIFLVGLSTAQASTAADQKQPDFSANVRRRIWGRGHGRAKATRKSLPAFLHSLEVSANETICLNPETVRAIPDQSQAVSAPAWKAVGLCLAKLEERGIETMSHTLCADDLDFEECIAEIKEWVKHKRVFSATFVSIHVGRTEPHLDKSARGPFKLFAPLPTTLARISRLSEVCMSLRKTVKTETMKKSYVQACLALVFYHPSSSAAWAQHFGFSQSQMYMLHWRMFFPLWHQFAFTAYLMHQTPHPLETMSRIRETEIRLLQPITDRHSTPETLIMDGVEMYLRALDRSLKLHGGPLDLTIEECARRMTFWAIQAHCSAGGLH